MIKYFQPLIIKMNNVLDYQYLNEKITIVISEINSPTEGTTIGDLEPIIVVVTQNINSLIALRDQVDDVIALLKSKCEAVDEQIS